MHLHLCCIIALAFLTPLDTKQTCDDCSFPNQMKGDSSWQMKTANDIVLLMSRKGMKFELDFQKKLIRHYSSSSKETFEFIYDLDKNLMYKLTSSDNCKYVKLIPELKIPSCVPSDLHEFPGVDEVLYIPYRPDDRDSVQYFLKKNEKCKPTRIVHYKDWNSTTKVTIQYTINEYKLPNDVLQSPFYPNTSACIESNIDLLIAQGRS